MWLYDLPAYFLVSYLPLGFMTGTVIKIYHISTFASSVKRKT